MSTRRKYSAEFKREAVGMANQPEVTKAQIGQELGLSPNMPLAEVEVGNTTTFFTVDRSASGMCVCESSVFVCWVPDDGSELVCPCVAKPGINAATAPTTTSVTLLIAVWVKPR